MRLALLVGYNPKAPSQPMGPVVSLPSGFWEIRSEKRVDSEFHVEHDLPVTGASKNIPGPCKVRCVVDKRGTEPYFNVYAERVCQ